MSRIGLALLITLAGAVSLGAVTEYRTTRTEDSNRGLGSVITDQSGSSIGWTGWINVSGLDGVAFDSAYTNSAGTAVTMRCETDRVNSTANDGGYDLHATELTLASGAVTATSGIITWSNAVSGNENWTWQVVDIPANFINCGFTITSGDGSDDLDVTARALSP